MTSQTRTSRWAPRISIVTFVAAACVLMLSTRQTYAMLAMKGLPPPMLMFVLVGVLGVYAALAGHSLSIGAVGITLAILTFVLATLVSWHGVTTRLLPAAAYIQASQGLSMFAVAVVAVVGLYYLFATNRDRGGYALATILQALVIGAAITAVFALIQFGTGIDIAAKIRIPGLMKYIDTGVAHGIVRQGVVRAQGAAAHALELSAVLTTIMPIGIALAYSAKAAGKRAWPWATLTAIVLAGAVVTVSRSAFIGIGVAVLVMAWRWPVRRLANLVAVAAGLAAVAAVSGLSVFDAIIKTFLSSDNDTSLQSRGRGIDYVMAHWTEHLWFGQGAYTYPIDGYQPVLDNEYLSRLIECGIVGLITLVMLLLIAIAYAAAARKRCTNPATRELIAGVLGALVALTVVSSILDVSAFQQISMVRWILVILAAAAWRLSADSADSADSAAPAPAPMAKDGPTLEISEPSVVGTGVSG